VAGTDVIGGDLVELAATGAGGEQDADQTGDQEHPGQDGGQSAEAGLLNGGEQQHPSAEADPHDALKAPSSETKLEPNPNWVVHIGRATAPATIEPESM
jgi:hypothetical protein